VNFCRKKSLLRGAIQVLVGVLVGAGTLWWIETKDPSGVRDAPDGILPLSAILQDAHAALEEGDYTFFPNRRSVWVINRTNGRMAHYIFRDDEMASVDRSRISQMDLNTFPRKDTYLTLSDRNLNDILWACNVRTGDLQMWHLARDGSLKAETPIATSADLRDRTAP
jgi:hypothetical protein